MQVPAPVPLVYANWIKFVPGPFDLSLDLGYFGPDTPPQSTMRLVVTWEHAKLLHSALGELVAQREENVGEIKHPPGVQLSSGEPPAEGGNQP